MSAGQEVPARDHSAIASMIGGVGMLALLLLVFFQLLRLARSSPQWGDLDYSATLQELDSLWRGGPGDSLVIPAKVEVLLDGTTRRADTISVIADTNQFPSFRVGGAGERQVREFNLYQVRRLELGPALFDSSAGAHSLLTIAVDNSGEPQSVRRAAAAYGLARRGLISARWTGAVRLGDAEHGRGLVGRGFAVDFQRGGTLGNGCRIPAAVAGVTRLFSCKSRGNTVEEQLSFVVNRRGELYLKASSWSGFWALGRRIARRDSIAGGLGVVLDAAPLVASAILEFNTGLLSWVQSQNGVSIRISDPRAPEWLRGLGWAVTDSTGATPDDAGDLQLALSGAFSRDLQAELQALRDTLAAPPIAYALGLIVNVATGEIVALGEVGDPRPGGLPRLFEPQAMGSSVKLPLVVAALWARPELAGLRLLRTSDIASRVAGIDVPPFEAVCRGHGWIDLTTFLMCSSNEFAATMLLAALADTTATGHLRRLPAQRGDHATLGGRPLAVSLPIRGGVVPREVLLSSPFYRALNTLFDVSVDPSVTAGELRSGDVWKGLRFDHSGRRAVIKRELWPLVSTPHILERATDSGASLALLSRYSYGVYSHRWTPMDLVRAYARVATDRVVQLRFARADPNAAADTSIGLSTKRWYRDIIAGLAAAAGPGGTAAGIHEALAPPGVSHPVVLAKTGTIDFRSPDPDLDLYVKDLVFLVGARAPGTNAGLSCGLAGLVYFRFDREAARRLNEGGKNLPPVAVSFAKSSVARILQAHWSQIRPCESRH